MSELAGHTIHRDHIHHGWNNAFEPCLRIAPGESVQFETIDASSGQLTQDVDRRGSREARPRSRQPGDRAGLDRRRDAGRRAQGHDPVAAAFGLGLDRQHPRLRPAHRPVPRTRACTTGTTTPALTPAMYGPGGRVPLRPFTGTIGVAPAEPGPAQHHSAAQRRRQHGCARHRRRHRALPAGRGRRRAVLGRRHPCGAGRRRGLRHGDREPDRRRPEVRAREGRPPALAALRDAGPGDRPFRQARATR